MKSIEKKLEEVKKLAKIYHNHSKMKNLELPINNWATKTKPYMKEPIPQLLKG